MDNQNQFNDNSINSSYTTDGYVNSQTVNIPEKKNKKVLKGILWIFSGWIIIFTVIILQILFRLVFNTVDGNIFMLLVNIFTWLFGLAGFMLIFAGPIIGIIILTKK
ncbi:MAG: hypothetical protein MUF85_01295 [Patescibacteria group bacterium]|jgi:hypothetical protein|nr:hypothetical protein [Patescibacteria group bacterium]